MAKKSSPMKSMIKETLNEMKNNPSGEFPSDPMLESDDSELSGPERFAKGQKAKDEVIIDSQLADIAGQEGYFLKLKKEMRPGLGEWMLMKTIETEWRRWADTETEVARIVKEHTRIAPLKWGTGPYRIEYGCKGGMRGKAYPVKDYWINAEEEMNGTVMAGATTQPVNDPATQVTAQLDTLGKLLDVTRSFQPTPIDPAKTQEQIANAFTQGMQLKVGEGSSSTTLMATMMTGLIGMMTAMMTRDNNPRVVNPTEGEGGLKGMLETLKTFGVIGQEKQEKQKTTIEFITELKALGMDLFEKKDPIAQLGQLKQLANIAGELMGLGGTGEKPGILEKIVDMVGPAIPGMIKDLKDTATNAVAVQVEAGKNIERARVGGPTDNAGTQMNVKANTGSMGSITMPGSQEQIAAFFNGLYEAVNTNNRMFYPVVYTSLLQDAQGQALIAGIVNGTQTAKEVVEMLQVHGGDRYKDSEFVVKRLVGYTNGFIIWIRDMMKPKPHMVNETGHENIRESKPSANSYDAQCPLCGTVFAFENEQAFVEEKEKECGIEHNGVMCPGMIQPMVKAS